MGNRFAVASFWRVVLCPASPKSNLFFVVRSGIFRARLHATELLESARIRLLSVLHHTARPLPARKYNIAKAAKPNPAVLSECLFQGRSAGLPIQRHKCLPGRVLGGIWRGLRHQFAWLALLCLCFWRFNSGFSQCLQRKPGSVIPHSILNFYPVHRHTQLTRKFPVRSTNEIHPRYSLSAAVF